MRTVPFKNLTPTPVAPPAEGEVLKINQRTFEESRVRDLSALTARPVTPQKTVQETPQQPAAQEPAKTETPAGEEKPAAETSSATLTKTEELKGKVEDFKKKLEEDIARTIEDPKRAAANAFRLLNIIRFFAYPWIYKKILFAGAEAENIEKILKKVGDAGMKGDEAKLNDYESALLKKWRFWEGQAAKVSWSEDEIKVLTELGYLQMAKVQFFRWLMEHEFMIAIIVIEGQRFGPVIANRMGLGEMSFDKIMFSPQA